MRLSAEPVVVKNSCLSANQGRHFLMGLSPEKMPASGKNEFRKPLYLLSAFALINSSK